MSSTRCTPTTAALKAHGSSDALKALGKLRRDLAGAPELTILKPVGGKGLSRGDLPRSHPRPSPRGRGADGRPLGALVVERCDDGTDPWLRGALAADGWP